MDYKYKTKKFKYVKSLVKFLNEEQIPKENIIETVKDNETHGFILIYIEYKNN
jgi:hypothetical protein